MTVTGHQTTNTAPTEAWWWWYRPLAFALTVLVLVVCSYLALLRWQTYETIGYVAVDYRIHLTFAQRFVDTGSMYLPLQLAGPFDPQSALTGFDSHPSMYPPHAAYLFVPFLVLPAFLWWAIPLGLSAYLIASWRPAAWAWPILAMMAFNPVTVTGYIVGNTTIWLVALVGAGLRWGWPAILITLKPSLLPFALIGIRHRSWWVAGIVLALLSLPLLGQWFAYLEVVQNAQTTLLYSLGSVPMMLLMIVAWLSRSRSAGSTS